MMASAGSVCSIASNSPAQIGVIMPRYALETIIVILLILWLLGAFVINIGTDLIHLLLVIVLIVVVLRVLQGRRL
jgi:hypothetical protein